MEKQEFTITVYTENQVGLLHRITTIFTKRKINLESLTTSESEIEGIHRFTIAVTETQKTSAQILGTWSARESRESLLPLPKIDPPPHKSTDTLPATKIMPTELTSQPQDMQIVDQDHRDEHADDTSKMQSRKRLAPTFSNDLES